jgi:hypothetical protein
MTKITTLLGCAIVLTASLALAQPRSKSSNASGSNTTSGGEKCANTTSACTKGTSPANGQSAGNVAAGLPGQSRSVLGRVMSKTVGKAMPHPGTPDFLPASAGSNANW